MSSTSWLTVLAASFVSLTVALVLLEMIMGWLDRGARL